MQAIQSHIQRKYFSFLKSSLSYLHLFSPLSNSVASYQYFQSPPTGCNMLATDVQCAVISVQCDVCSVSVKCKVCCIQFVVCSVFNVYNLLGVVFSVPIKYIYAGQNL